MRLIDADELIQAHRLRDYDPKQKITVTTLSEFTRWIDEAPTVEIKAINHGYWLISFPYGPEHEHNFKCSECGHVQWCVSNYCGNCGATMDEGWLVDTGDQNRRDNTDD